MTNLTPMRVEIWRYTDTVLTIARSDGACWNTPDVYLTKKAHDGIWDSTLGKFISDRFSDGTPVAAYEGLEPEPKEEPWQS